MEEQEEYIIKNENTVDLLTGRPLENGLHYREDGIWLTQAGSGAPVSAEIGAYTTQNSLECNPMPVRSKADITYYVEKDANVRIELVDNLGRSLKLLIKAYHSAGKYSFGIGPDLPDSPGIYYLVMKTRERVISTKIIVIK